MQTLSDPIVLCRARISTLEKVGQGWYLPRFLVRKIIMLSTMEMTPVHFSVEL